MTYLSLINFGGPMATHVLAPVKGGGGVIYYGKCNFLFEIFLRMPWECSEMSSSKNS